MTNILIKPNQVRSVAHQLEHSARAIQSNIHTVDQIVSNLPSEFEGQRAAEILRRYQAIKTKLFSSWKLIHGFSEKLNSIAERFEEADKKLTEPRMTLLENILSRIFHPGWMNDLKSLYFWPSFWRRPWWDRWRPYPFPFWPPVFFPQIPWQIPRPLPLPGHWPEFPKFPKLPDIILPDWVSKDPSPWIPVDDTPSSGGSGNMPPAEPPTDPVETGSNTSNAGNPQQNLDAIATLNVESNSRYTPYKKGQGDTYCNIFAMDYAHKMEAPLPEYLDWNSDGKIDRYLNANRMVQWLRGDFQEGGGSVTQGPELGWHSVSADEAAAYAKEGKVVLAGWQNPKGLESSGHMAVVRPESEPGSIVIAQAGKTNFSNGPISNGFGDRSVEYFVYDPAK